MASVSRFFAFIFEKQGLNAQVWQCGLLIFSVLFSSCSLYAVENITYTTKTGDLIWQIAGKLRPDESVSRYQVMLALLRQNPQAFSIPCNINSLKTGVILTLPSMAVIQQVTHAAAFAEIEAQRIVWESYRQTRKPIECQNNIVVNAPAPPALEPILAQQVDLQAENPSVTLLPPPVLSEIPPTSAAPASSSVVTEESKITTETAINLTFLRTIPEWVLFALLSLLLLCSWLYKQFLRYPPLPTPISPALATPAPASEQNLLTNDPIAQRMRLAYDPVQRLALARDYLAAGKQQELERLLQWVLHGKNAAYQQEARQLLAIARTMQQLAQQRGHVASAEENATETRTEQLLLGARHHVESENVSPQLELPLNPPLPPSAEYLAEKVLSILDQELNMQGQLLAAYQERRGSAGETPYHPHSSVETTPVDVGSVRLKKPREASAPPRRL